MMKNLVLQTFGIAGVLLSGVLPFQAQNTPDSRACLAQTHPAPVRQELPQPLPLIPVAAKQTGQRKADTAISVTLALRLPKPAALQSVIDQQLDPHSPYYHRFLTVAQFTEQFAPSPNDLAAVVAFLKSSGLKITETAPNRLWVKATGTVGQVQKAFGTTLLNYSDGQNTYFANQTLPTLPPNIAALVDNVFGLDNLPLLHPVRRQTGSLPYNPISIRIAYNLNPFYTVGNRGRGKTVAIFSSFATTPSDTTRFINDWIKTMPTTPANYSANITYVNVDGGPTNQPGNGNIEADLDLEMVLAAAPDAAVRFYGGPFTGQGQYDTLARIVSDNAADIASESYGGPEANYYSGEHTLLMTAASQGISYFCSSGDHGAGEGGSLSTAYPASDPNVIAIGGTTLTLNSSAQIISETGWNGSGGGISTIFAAPAWQANGSGSNFNSVLNITNTGNKRLVPDVALNASPGTGYLVYSGGNTYQVGGTSASCPMWAGITALLEIVIDNGGTAHRQGNINALLYAHFPENVFRDITVGNNRQSSTGTNYDCKTGYDLVTGLGSADFQVLAAALQHDILYVDKAYTGTEAGTPNQPYHTVAAALNAASASRATYIYVRANNYSEYPTIYKPVTILNWMNSGTVSIGTP